MDLPIFSKSDIVGKTSRSRSKPIWVVSLKWKKPYIAPVKKVWRDGHRHLLGMKYDPS
jgi:hypothetical protein